MQELSEFDNISLSELKKIIQSYSMQMDNEVYVRALTGAIGVYVEKLQVESNRHPVYPLDLLPIPSFLLKEWGQKYAALVIKEERQLLRYQEEAALYYTRFRNIKHEQWDLMKADAIKNLALYNMEVRENGFSNLSIQPDFKEIIDNYQSDYKEGVKELHSYLRSLKSNKGCLFIAMILLLIVVSSFIFI